MRRALLARLCRDSEAVVELDAGAEAVAGVDDRAAGRGVERERCVAPQPRQASDADAMQTAPHSRLGFPSHASTRGSLAHRMTIPCGCERMPAARAKVREEPVLALVVKR
jgi:hypothetical protein